MEKQKGRSRQLKDTGSAVTEDLTWDEVNCSVLGSNIRLLYYMGLWPLGSSRAYHAYTAFSLSFSAAAIVMKVVGACYNLSDIDQVTGALSTILPMSGGLANGLFLMRRRSAICRMVRSIDRLVAQQRRYFERDERMAAVVGRAQRKTLLVTLAVSGYLFAIAGYWIFIAFLEPPSKRIMPFVQLPWMATSGLGLFWFTFALQLYTAPFCSYTTLFVEFFYLAVMLHLSAQFKVLGSRFASLGRSPASKAKAGTESDLATADSNAVYDELRLCVETHQELLRFVRFLDDVMSPFAMMQFVAGTLAVCVVLFQAANNQDLNTNLKCAGWLPGPSLELFIYCGGAHEVVHEGEALVMAAYDSLWYTVGPRIGRAIRMVITRAQVPPVLTAGHLYPITRPTFVSLVNAAYSYYALLSQMQNK
ncbi:odorant receptor Or2-like [Schistocerca cancellata]|uniref:odorant receptor Or2-like n=1 Tax=Schistocerca cancellata TaxID=274614 RepID=UPI0021186E2C|nr:odorant receptor Or2-like [Schistocerca cancellata]